MEHPLGVTLVLTWICICFLCPSHAALSAEPRQPCSACDLKAQLSPQLLVCGLVTAQVVSNRGLCRGLIELLPPTIITTCELKQKQLYLSKEETGLFLGFGFVVLFVLLGAFCTHTAACAVKQPLECKWSRCCVGNKACCVVQ